MVIYELTLIAPSCLPLVLSQLSQAGLNPEEGYKILWDPSSLVRVQSHIPPAVVDRAEEIFRRNEFDIEKEFRIFKGKQTRP